jgi:DNA-binding GntR family transcriptional regulator
MGNLPGMVDHMDPTPLKVQLANELRAKIQSGELASGQPIPSESYLQQQHGVARGTVRAAVKILQDEGLVITIQGRATYVK